MNSQFVERRRHKRITVDKSVLNNPEFTANDLSESGMQLSCATEQRKGRKIDITLNLEGQTVPLKAEIMWCRKASSVYETGYHVGVQFIEYSVSHELLIRDFVDKKSE